MKSTIKQIIAIFFLSLIIVIATIMIPDKVDDYTELERVKFGYPIHYIIQDQTALSPSSYPIYSSILSPLEHPITISFWKFIISIFVVMSFLFFIFVLWKYTNIIHFKKN